MQDRDYPIFNVINRFFGEIFEMGLLVNSGEATCPKEEGIRVDFQLITTVRS